MEGTHIIYLASPYSHPNPEVKHERFEEIARIAGTLMGEGQLIFCPITHTHPIQLYSADLPSGWDFWQRFDKEFLDFCKGMIVVMMDGWKESVGVQAEIQYMKMQNKNILYLDVSIHPYVLTEFPK